ncbi:MAG: hypothetical protein QM627_12250 [Luteolibacter sp.]
MLKHFLSALYLLPVSLSAAVLNVDYSYADYLNQFQVGSAGRAAIDRAAADLSAVLANHQLAAVPTRTAVGEAAWNNGQFDLVSTIALSAGHLIQNPTSVSDYARLSNETFAANELRIYVGMSNMQSRYAVGAPAVVTITQVGAGYIPSWAAALTDAELKANQLLGRGTNVVASVWNGSMPFGEVTGNYTVSLAPMAGSVAFNINEFWNVDYTSPVGATQYDLYSAALQEMLRAIGVEPSETLQRGQRYSLTESDFAALQASGWTVVPEPSALIFSVISLPFITRRKRP